MTEKRTKLKRMPPDLKTLKVFTSGQVAKICRVCPRTVTRFTVFEEGDPKKLWGYRIPGSEDRRYRRAELIRFLKYHGMPLTELEDTRARVLIVSADAQIGPGLANQIENDCLVAIAENVFTAGSQVEAIDPQVVVVDFLIGVSAVSSILRNLNENPKYSQTTFVAVLSEGHATIDPSVSQDWVAEVWQRPVSLQDMAFRIGQLLQRQKVDRPESVAA